MSSSSRLLAYLLIPGLAGCLPPYQRWTPSSSPGPGQVTVRGGQVELELDLLAAPESLLVLDRDGGGAEGSFQELAEERGCYEVYRALTIRAHTTVAQDPRDQAPPRPDAFHAGRANSAKLLAMYGEEHAALANLGRSQLAGLALSGGGVRAASFAQGVLQGLHELGLLRKFGYLSSVSGGGYTAAWYVTHPQADAELLEAGSLHQHHLAQYGNYLTSGHYTGSTTRYLANLGLHALSYPYHLVCNGLLDWDENAGFLRPFYRAGIMRAYLYKRPLADEDQLIGRAVYPIHDYRPGATGKPLWICNMNLSLIDDGTHHRNRVGDNFELTPLRAGATAVGYVRTPRDGGIYRHWTWDALIWDVFDMDHGLRWMTPDYGAAISGAAVDAPGLGKSWLFWPMEVLNLNLGYFVPGWAPGWVAADPLTLRGLWTRLWHQLTAPAFLHLALPDTDSHHRSVEGRQFYLSDGGHIENLGVYALVRRGCRTIVVADSVQDTTANGWDGLGWQERGQAFDDLRRLEELLLSDFGARVEIDWQDLRMGRDGQGLAFVGKIRALPIMIPFDAPTDLLPDVTIIYLKAAFDDDNPPQERSSFMNAEKADDPTFANRTTADVQWSERQVLAQRELGRSMALRCGDVIRQALDTNGQLPRDPLTLR